MKYTKFDFSDRLQELSLWQSSNWMCILEKSKQAREVFYFGNPKSTFFLVEIRSLGAGFFGAFSLGVRNSQVASDVSLCIDALIDFLQREGVIFWQIEPIEHIQFLQNIDSDSIFKNFLTPFTRVIPLEDDVDEILKNMQQKGRYAIKNAEKKGVEIEIITDFTDKIIDQWMELLKETTARDNFSHNSRNYYVHFLQELRNNAYIVAAKYEENYIAMTINVCFLDVALYYYGASTSDLNARKLASSYLTIWNSMLFAKEKGAKVYDLFGIADPNNPNDPLLGVSQFKQKLGGKIIELPQKILVKTSWKYTLFKILQKFKKIIKK